MKRRFHQVPHYRTSKRGKRFKAGRGSKKVKVKMFRRPTRSTMSAYKGLSYNQIKKVYPINPLRDDDGDKKRNWEDCRPFDRKKQDMDIYLGEDDPRYVAYTDDGKLFLSQSKDKEHEDIQKIADTIEHEEIHNELSKEFDDITSQRLDNIYDFETNKYTTKKDIPRLRELAHAIAKIDSGFERWLNNLDPDTTDKEEAIEYARQNQKERDELMEEYKQLNGE